MMHIIPFTLQKIKNSILLSCIHKIKLLSGLNYFLFLLAGLKIIFPA